MVTPGAPTTPGPWPRRLRYLVPAGIVFVGSMLLDLRTLQPGLGFWDTGEFQALGPVLGIAHPTGYPSYTLLLWLASVVLQPFGDPALRANLLSAILVSGAAALVAVAVVQVTRRAAIGLVAGGTASRAEQSCVRRVEDDVAGPSPQTSRSAEQQRHHTFSEFGQMDDAAMVFGASPMRCFWEVTLPTIWPSLLGAFLITFILAFNNLEISFYNLGAIPTLPSVAWGSLRFGLGPELFALAALTNGLVFTVFAVMYGLMRTGIVKFGYRGG